MTVYRWNLIFCVALLTASCSDEGATGSDEPTQTAETSEEENNSEPSDEVGEPDSQTEPSADATQGEDVWETDTGGGEEPAAIPRAKVYENNPLDNGTIVVEMPHLTDEDGFLTGLYAKVWNCTQEDGGEPVDFGFGSFQLCEQKQVAQLGEDGNYFHIPPSSSTDGSDAFAELMMYYHVNLIHDYFQLEHGMDQLDFPLTAIVNAQANVALLGGWMPFDNAAFIPEESWAQFPLPLEVGQGGAIVFGQGSAVDYAYEADVIYHEYTHAMIGTTRLLGYVRDEYGPDPSPGAMNEGFADYFATTLSDDPVMGDYALSNVSGFMGDGPAQDLRRDLSEFKSCPADITGEVHADGEIIGNAAWTMRETLGAEITDTIILNALQTFDEETNVTKAAEAIIAEAAAMDPPVDAEVLAIFEERGMIGCDRVFDFEGSFVAQPGTMPIMLPGTQSTGLLPFQTYIPSYTQWRFQVPTDAVAIRVTMNVQAGGGFMGFGGGEAPELLLAVKAGGDPITYQYDGSQPATHNANDVLPTETSDGLQEGLVKYTTYLHGDCLSAEDEAVIQIHNISGSGGTLYTLDIDAVDEVPEGDWPSWAACE